MFKFILSLLFLSLSLFGMQPEKKHQEIKSLFELAAKPALGFILESLDNSSLKMLDIYHLNELPNVQYLKTTLITMSPYLKGYPEQSTQLRLTMLIRLHQHACKRGDLNA